MRTAKTIRQWLDSQRGKSSYNDFEFILQHVLNKKRMDLYLNENQFLTQQENNHISSMLEEYQKGRPLAYLFKEAEFYGFRFHIEEGVFIPRPETEMLVDKVIHFYSKLDRKKEMTFIDFGCGSGCIGLSVLLKTKNSHLIAIDADKRALQIAKRNAQRYFIQDRVTFIESDVLNLDFKNFLPISFIVANPPYISYDDSSLSRSVLQNEPLQALYSGNQGMESIESWLDLTTRIFNDKVSEKEVSKKYFFEIGYNQSSKVKSMLSQNPYVKKFDLYKDIQGYDRVVCCEF